MIRKICTEIHLWLGLISGIILFLICFSGTLYTFKSDIESFTNRRVVFNNDSKANIEKVNIDTIFNHAKSKNISAITLYEDNAKNYLLSNGKKSVAYVNPYTSEELEATKSKGDFFDTMMALHRFLLLDTEIGRPIVGWVTVMFVLISISGLILWIPKKWKQWKQGFKIKLSGSWKRTNHDLHNTLGFYSFIFLIVMGLTGLCWSFNWYKDGVSNIMGSTVFGSKKEKPSTIDIDNNASSISLSEIVSITNNILPYSGDIKVTIPEEGKAYSISKNKNGFFALASQDKIEINPYTKEVAKVDIFKDKPISAQIVGLIRPLHTGEVFGVFSKIIYFITCLIATSLPITGTLIWLNKRKKKSY